MGSVMSLERGLLIGDVSSRYNSTTTRDYYTLTLILYLYRFLWVPFAAHPITGNATT